MSDPRFVTLAEAGAILGGDRPYSTKTIQRLIRAGRLKAIGERQLRRVVRASLEQLIAGLESGVPLWPEQNPAPSASAAMVASPGTRRPTSGSSGSRSATASGAPFEPLTRRTRNRSMQNS